MDYEGMFEDRLLKLAGSALWLEEMVEGVVLSDLAWMRIEKVIDTWLNQYS